MEGKDDHSQPEALSTRPPEEKELVALCGELNRQGARYVVVGGFAIIAGGYPRFTSGIDLLIDTSLENEGRVRKALETLPDRAVDDMKPGEVHQFKVIRIADEIMVDLMESACGIE